MHILAEICTKNRYHSTLPLAIQSVALQTRTPDELVIFDDSDNPEDLRNIPTYKYLFHLLDEKKIAWKVLFGAKRGQHWNHEKAQMIAKDLVWRLDDDCVAEPDCLKWLEFSMEEGVGAVGGLVLTPPHDHNKPTNYNAINKLGEQNCQWTDGWDSKIDPIEVDHLYSSFLFRKDIAHYELSLSPVAHREETIFSHRIKRAGYKLLVTPMAISWHFRNPEGGIRSHTDQSLYDHDERIFRVIQNEWNSKKLVVLDNGIGDHIVFKKILPDLKAKYNEVIVACCYPFVFEGEQTISISQAKQLVDIDRYNIYRFMWDNSWASEMELAYRQLYL